MKRVVLAAAPLAFVAGLAFVPASGCGGASGSAGAVSDASTGPITIGVIDSLTGGLSGLGVGLNQVIGVAARQINRVGVAGGRQIIFDVRDDGSDPAQSVLAARALLGEGVVGILGPISSEEVHQVEGLTYAANTVEISATATSVLLDRYPAPVYFFRTAPPDSLQALAVMDYVRRGIYLAPDGGTNVVAVGTPGDAGVGAMLGGTCKNAYIVNGDDSYGTSLGDSVATAFLDNEGAVVGRDPVPTTLQDNYSSVLDHIEKANPDCVILIVYSDVGAEFMTELRARNAWHGVVCGTDGEYDSNFIPRGQSDPANPSSPNSTAGVSGTSPDSAPDTPEYKAFVSIWQESYPGTQPPIYGANQYDATILLALAIQKSWKDGISVRDGLLAISSHADGEGGVVTEDAGSGATSTVIHPDEVVTALNDIAHGEPIVYKGASGDCAFDAQGDVRTSYSVWQVYQRQDQTYAFRTIATIPASEL